MSETNLHITWKLLARKNSFVCTRPTPFLTTNGTA